MFIQRLGLTNILSFAKCSVELRDLNVLIGPNGSGKSNLMHVLDLVRRLPGDFVSFMINNRGADLWLRLEKGVDTGAISVGFLSSLGASFDYTFSFSASGATPVLRNEEVRTDLGIVVTRNSQSFQKNGSNEPVELRPNFTGRSVLGMFRGPEESSIIPDLANDLEAVRLYQEFSVGRIRSGLSASQSYGPPLLEDGSNLAEMIQELNSQLPELNMRLKDINADVLGVRSLVRDGRFILMAEERGLSRGLPGAALSDGTLRFLCLAAILVDPKPPPLICIEEPERGLHPDAIRSVGEMLREASRRTQIIVTTHSRDLVDCFTSQPEDVLVCEKNLQNESAFRRFERSELEGWLDDYLLGEAWQRGAIGGTRW